MGSLRAQKAAIKVSENLRGNKKPKTLGQILKEVGYADTTALSPTLVTTTKSFITAAELEGRPLVDGMQAMINKFKGEIERRDLAGEDTRILVGSMDILIKNFQLLSGGATERQVFVLPSEVINRNEITTSEPKTALPEAPQELKDGSS